MRLGTLVVISFTVAPIATIASQEPPALNAGARIRATSTSVSGGPLLGTVLALDADSLIVQGDTGTWRLSLASLTHLDKRRRPEVPRPEGSWNRTACRRWCRSTDWQRL
jgi:hypothetical protein